jgi:hypothetical protein
LAIRLSPLLRDLQEIKKKNQLTLTNQKLIKFQILLKFTDSLPGIPGRLRFFLAVAADLDGGCCGGGGGGGWLPDEETLASPEAVDELSKSTGMIPT